MALVQHTTECSTNNLGCIAGTQHVHWDSQGDMICEELGDTITLIGCGIVIPEKDISPVPCLVDNECDPCGCGGGDDALTDVQLAQVAESPIVTAVVEQIATDCTAQLIDGAATAKAAG